MYVYRLIDITFIYSGTYEVLFAGADRNVYIYDSRTWKSRLKWRSPCKYDIIKIMNAKHDNSSNNNDNNSSNVNSNNNSHNMLAYLVGSDNEIMLCNLLSNTSHLTNNIDAG